MNLLVSCTGRFALTGDGVLWGPPSLEYGFWKRYLDVFEPVRLMARIRTENSPPPGWKKASGPGIEAIALPHFVGAAALVRTTPVMKPLIGKALAEAHAVLLRVPCGIGDQVWRGLGARPYAVEVVGDPYDVFAPGASAHPLRPAVRWWMARQLKRECAQASAAAYVTAETLQRRYTPGARTFTTHFSSIEIEDRDFLTEPRQSPANPRSFALVTVGTLQQLYKGPDVLLEAVHIALRDGLDIRLVLIGDGQYRPKLEAQVQRLGLERNVRFLGELESGRAVRDQLDFADLFVLASRTEGLPRAMIEAMARGLPCVGTTAGGIPELLPAEDLVPPGDARSLAAKIREVLTDPGRQGRMSARNLAAARSYQSELLRQRRVSFYRHLENETRSWFKRRSTYGK